MGTNPMMVLLLQITAIAMVFYFLIIRPQGKARKQAADMLAALKKGDEVTTAGGIVGKVRDIRDHLVTIESKIRDLRQLASELKRLSQCCQGGGRIAECRIVEALSSMPARAGLERQQRRTTS